MQLTTYVLFNPCCFTHLVVRDNDMAFNCKDELTNEVNKWILDLIHS